MELKKVNAKVSQCIEVTKRIIKRMPGVDEICKRVDDRMGKFSTHMENSVTIVKENLEIIVNKFDSIGELLRCTPDLNDRMDLVIRKMDSLVFFKTHWKN